MAVGHCYGKHTDETGTTTLPDHFKCPENTIASLISAIYPGINEDAVRFSWRGEGVISQVTSVHEISELHGFLNPHR